MWWILFLVLSVFCVVRFNFRVVGFVFALRDLFLCCAFYFCVARFVFVLWVLFLCCKICFFCGFCFSVATEICFCVLRFVSVLCVLFLCCEFCFCILFISATMETTVALATILIYNLIVVMKSDKLTKSCLHVKD